MARIENFWRDHVITRSGAEAVVYDLRDQDRTTITLPAASKWTSGLHWHETHVEYLQVIKGSVKVTLNGRSLIIDAPQNDEDTAVVKVDKFVRHEWGRADYGLNHEAGEVVVLEYTEPADGSKSDFFWCVNGVILNSIAALSAAQGMHRIARDWAMYLRLLCVFSAYDNYPVILSLPSVISYRFPALQILVESFTTKTWLEFGVLFARLSGLSLRLEDYLPPP